MLLAVNALSVIFVLEAVQLCRTVTGINAAINVVTATFVL